MRKLNSIYAVVLIAFLFVVVIVDVIRITWMSEMDVSADVSTDEQSIETGSDSDSFFESTTGSLSQELEYQAALPEHLAGIKWRDTVDDTALGKLLENVVLNGMTEAELLARGKVIYLTFDDGPSEHTEKLLDILDRYQVKATFFVTNGYPEYADCIGEAARRGHSIGIHCYSHWYEKIYASEDAYLADMKKMDDIVFEQTGKRTKLMRFPGGSSNKVSKQYNRGIMTRLEMIIEGMGYHYFDWNVDSNDAGGTTETDQVAQNVISVLEKKNVAVVLQHDSYGYSVAAVEKIISWGLENGYVFLPLTEESPGFHHGIVN